MRPGNKFLSTQQEATNRSVKKVLSKMTLKSKVCTRLAQYAYVMCSLPDNEGYHTAVTQGKTATDADACYKGFWVRTLRTGRGESAPVREDSSAKSECYIAVSRELRVGPVELAVDRDVATWFHTSRVFPDELRMLSLWGRRRLGRPK